jgi:hypothetical protein
LGRPAIIINKQILDYMKNLLSEEIERYRRLSKYNPKFTLTENVDIILEKGPNFSTLVKGVESIFGKELSLVMKDLKIAGMDAGRVTKLLEMDAKSFEKEWAKAVREDLKAGFPQGSVGPLTKELSKIDFLKRVTTEVKAENRVLTTAEMEQVLLRAKNESQAAAKLKATTVKPTVTRQKPKIDDADINSGKDALVKDPTLKKLNWKSLVKKGSLIGLSAGALYYIYKLTHQDEPPIVDPEEEGTITPSPTQAPRPGTNRYRNCSGTYKKGCKTQPTGAIGQVQACLGLVQDGRFWVKTQAALELKGFANGFTDADIIKICGNQTPTPTPTPAESEFEDIDGEDASNIIDN